VTAAELGLMLFLGEDIPLGQTGLQPGASWGARARVRPLAEAGVEAAGGHGPLGTDVSLAGVGFLGDPVADLVASARFGGGVRVREGEAPHLLLEAGLGLDLTLAPVVDLQPDLRATWTLEDEVCLRLSVGLALHSPRRFDRDSDGVSDRQDRCPAEPEDLDGFDDGDGCPELDNDKDAVADTVDSCPLVAEDRDGFLDGDGCPDPDNDGDGLIDDRDACINEAEDPDGYRDTDGCADADNEADGVADVDDRCPNVAEDRDGFEDGDGCPDPDNDADGVGDVFDPSPNDAENINYFQDDDGVPDVLPPTLRAALGPQPRYRFNRDELTEGGVDRAALLAAAMEEHVGVRVRITVRDLDESRAHARAESIAASVVRFGVAADRLEPVGEHGPAETLVELIP
jgi:hypothetical protein